MGAMGWAGAISGFMRNLAELNAWRDVAPREVYLYCD
jgi:hypothetical protein